MDGCRYIYANNMPFYKRDLKIHGFWCSGVGGGVLEPALVG